MEESKTITAKFRLLKYLVSDVSLKFSGKAIGENVKIGIEPEGNLNQNQKTFTLILHVVIRDDEKNLDLSMTLKGQFEYDTQDMNQLLPFMCLNAPAILFPYIRAYISNITALGGTSPVIIPTLNIEGVGKILNKKLKDSIGLGVSPLQSN